MATIDVAKVLIQPDLTGFAAQTDSGIDRGLSGAEASVDTVIAAMERQFAELADQIGSDFGQIQISAEEAFGTMASDFEATGSAIEAEFAGVAAAVDASFEEMQVTANHNLDQIAVKSEATSGRISGALAAIGSVGVPVLAAVGGGLGLLTAFGLKSAATLEQVQVAMGALTGSAAAGMAQFKQLQTFAAATPFNFSDLTTSAERFDAFSKAIGQTQAQLIPFLTTIGNLVSETGGGAQQLDSITLALGQTASQGKLTLGNLDQLNNALPGFSAVAALAAVRGETTAQVMQEISSGSIDASTGINQLLQGMQQFPGAAGAMAKQSLTLLGVFSTFQDTISQALSNAFQPVIPAIKDSLTQITPIIGAAITQLAPALGTITAGLLPVIAQLVTALTSILTPILSALGPALKPIGDMFAVLGPAIGDVVTALTPLIPLFAQIIDTIGIALAQSLTTVAPLLASLVPNLAVLALALLPLVPAMGQLLTLFLEIISPVTAFVGLLADHVTTFQAIVISLLAIGAMVKVFEAYKAVVLTIETVTKAWTAAQLALDVAMDANPVGIIIVAVAALVAGIVLLATKTQFFQTVWQGIWDFMQMVGAWFAGPFVNFFVDIGNWFAGPFLEPFKAIGAWFSGPFLNFFKDIGAWFSGPFTNFFVSIGRTISGLPGKITGIFSGAVHWLEDAGKNIIMGLVHGVEGAVKNAIEVVKKAMGSIISGAESALGIHSPSTVFMEIGRQSVAGYNQGIDAAAPSAATSINNLISPATKAAGSTQGAGAGSSLFGPGSIVVNMGAGASAADAYNAGVAIGQGINDTLTAMSVNNSVRAM